MYSFLSRAFYICFCSLKVSYIYTVYINRIHLPSHSPLCPLLSLIHVLVVINNPVCGH